MDRYAIYWLDPSIQQLRLWAKQAHAMYLYAEFEIALRELQHRLIVEPEEFGNKQYDFDSINASFYLGILPKWFAVGYGADRAAKQVVVHSLKTAPGSKLF